MENWGFFQVAFTVINVIEKNTIILKKKRINTQNNLSYLKYISWYKLFAKTIKIVHKYKFFFFVKTNFI